MIKDKKVYKKVVITTMTLASISIANASMSDCTAAAQAEDWNNAVEYCEPLAKDNKNALVLTSNAYAQLDNGIKTQKYSQMYIDKYAKKETNIKIVSGVYQSLGNYYYFGEDGADKDIQKGLEYITKGAQLGSFYASNEAKGLNKSFPVSYEWYTIGKLNGSNKYKQSYVYQNLESFKKQLPYCIALGKALVSESYYEGINSLPVDKSKAISLMAEATKLSPDLSITNFDMAKMYLAKGDNAKAYEYAQKAIKEPYAPAYQFLAQIELQKNTDKDTIKAHLEKAIELYKNPDSKYWDKYQAPCRPNFESYPDGFNQAAAKKMLAGL